MITKGGLNVTSGISLRICEGNIRFNAVAPGIVDTPLHSDLSKVAHKPVADGESFHDRRCCRMRSFTLLKLVKLPGRCCTSMAVRTWKMVTREIDHRPPPNSG